MTTAWPATRTLVLLAVLLPSCSRGATEPAETGKKTAPPAAAGNVARWGEPPCSIVPAQAVAGVLGKSVTTRDDTSTHTCQYVPEQSYPMTIAYYGAAGGKGEFEIFKARQKKGTAIEGIGVEAIDGSMNGAALAVMLADGRSFLVSGGDRESRTAIARLVPAR